MGTHEDDTPVRLDDLALKERFVIPRDLHRIWIRYIEKAADPTEWELANDTAVCLMTGNINSLGGVLGMRIGQLRLIPGFTPPNEEMLLKLLSRIAKEPSIARPVRTNPFNLY